MLVKAGTSQFQFSQAHKAFARLANTKCVVLGTYCIIVMVRLLYHGQMSVNCLCVRSPKLAVVEFYLVTLNIKYKTVCYSRPVHYELFYLKPGHTFGDFKQGDSNYNAKFVTTKCIALKQIVF